MLDRIEAFRRRRPRLTDDVVTLAHGAGGKASAALSTPCSSRRSRTTSRRRWPTPPRSTLPDAASGWRSAPTRSSCSRVRFPGGSIGHLAVHGTVNDLAVMGARPTWLSAAFVIEEGFPVAELRDDRRPTWPRRPRRAGVAIVTGDTKVVGRGAADGLYITTAGVGVHPGRTRRSGPSRCGRATSCSCRARSPTTAWR